MTLGGDAVHDPRIPVIDGRGEVMQEDERYAATRSELAIREPGAGSVDGESGRRRGSVRARQRGHRVTTILPLALPCST